VCPRQCVTFRKVHCNLSSPGTSLLGKLVRFFKNYEGIQNCTFHDHYVTTFVLNAVWFYLYLPARIECDTTLLVFKQCIYESYEF
jgi:hypothetical protein